jgi:YD repeat-containing protein
MIVACLAWLPVQAQNQTLNASLTTIIQTLLADPLPSAPAATPALVLQPAPTMDPAAKSMTRKSAFEYDQVSGLLTAEIVEPDFEPYRLVTRYSYDAWGNKNAATVSAPTSGAGAVAPRTSTATYDAHGQFQVSRTNALGHIERATYDPKFGLPVSQTGPNGLTTQWQYDSFGRKTMEIRADGGRTSWTYFYCQDMASGASPCPALARYVIQISQLGPDGVTVSGPWNKLYFDAINRQIRSESPAFDGIQIVAVDTEYDDLGRVSRSSRPHFGSQTPQWTVQTYDELDRVIVTTAPDATQTKILYKGLTTRTTNAAGQTQSRFTNSQGQIIGVTDALGSAINYQYDPFGNLTRTVDPGGNFLGFTYDLRGRRTSTSDPDMGAIAYRYDALDQVIAQVDAKGQATTLRYDSLGRIVGRIEPGLTSTWIYDSCAKGIGKLCAARTSGGYSRSYSYDALGRGIGITTVIDRTYSSAVSFDANGRVATRTTPSGIVLRYVYSPFGYLQEVRNNLGNALFWRAAEFDAEGNLRQQLFGNNVATTQNFDPATGTLLQISAGEGNRIQTFSYGYDGLGRMTSRSNNSQGLTESFTYDVLNRLTAANVSTVSSGGTYSARQTNVYDSIGNIQSRSDVGSYAYGTPNRQPHALNTVTLNDASRVLRTYDANGNLVQQARVDAAGTAIPDKKSMTISYTSFNMPSQMR